MDVNQPDNNDVAYVPSPDAVGNFNIITSNAPADFGNYIGGVIVESIKSGTNQFHGNVFEFVRNTDSGCQLPGRTRPTPAWSIPMVTSDHAAARRSAVE